MRFFLYEIVARIVAIYLCFDCSRTVWYGLVERKIAYFNSDSDFLDFFLDWSSRANWVAHRDAAPIRYWIQIGIQVILVVSCLLVAIFGWWQPNS
jgi:4-amino-4-deoxy-L-arabinose transferase-like glycosyltransferase